MNREEVLQCHAVIFAIHYPLDPEQELTPWYWYEAICEVLKISPYLSRAPEISRWLQLPRIHLNILPYRKQISTDYQLFCFHKAIDFMLLTITEDQYEWVIRELEHWAKERILAQEHVLQYEFEFTQLSEKMAAG
jgi:hypothetical protein